MPQALIAGCNGQDGSYLSDFLLARGYTVHGISLEGLRVLPDGPVSAFDLLDPTNVDSVIAGLQPDEIYYLAAFHHSSEDLPIEDGELVARSFAVNTLAVNHFLHSIGVRSPKSRFFYAATSRVFGDVAHSPQDEGSPFNPVCPYGISKAAGIHLCRYYRRSKDVFASSGILYNHESPRRGGNFISRKIVRAAVRIKRGDRALLTVGNLSAIVDWGAAVDYVDAMWRILQLEAPDDFVIASGETHTVQEMAEEAFSSLGLDWREYVREDRRVIRQSVGAVMRGDSSKLCSLTGWRPRTGFRELVLDMIRAESGSEESN